MILSQFVQCLLPKVDIFFVELLLPFFRLSGSRFSMNFLGLPRPTISIGIS